MCIISEGRLFLQEIRGRHITTFVTACSCSTKTLLQETGSGFFHSGHCSTALQCFVRLLRGDFQSYAPLFAPSMMPIGCVSSTTRYAPFTRPFYRRIKEASFS